MRKAEGVKEASKLSSLCESPEGGKSLIYSRCGKKTSEAGGEKATGENA